MAMQYNMYIHTVYLHRQVSACVGGGGGKGGGEGGGALDNADCRPLVAFRPVVKKYMGLGYAHPCQNGKLDFFTEEF